MHNSKKKEEPEKVWLVPNPYLRARLVFEALIDTLLFGKEYFSLFILFF